MWGTVHSKVGERLEKAAKGKNKCKRETEGGRNVKKWQIKEETKSS